MIKKKDIYKCDQCGAKLTKEESDLGDICFKCMKEDLTMIYNPKTGGYENDE